MHVVIELKRDANPQIILNQLFSYTQMQETVGVIMLALERRPAQGHEPPKGALEHYIEFQAEIIRRRTEFDLRKARERPISWRALKLRWISSMKSSVFSQLQDHPEGPPS